MPQNFAINRDWLARILCAIVMAFSMPGANWADDLRLKLLSHLQDTADARGVSPDGVRRESPDRDAAETLPAKPRRLGTLAEERSYSGPPAAIDGPEKIIPWDNAEPLPMTPGIIMDDLHEYPADDPIAMQHPLLGDPIIRESYARLSTHRNGFFQKLSLTGTWLPQGNDPNDFGFAEIDTFASFALPFPIAAWPLVITPGYNMHLLSGPQSPDLPARLYDTYIDFMWLPTFVHRYTLLLAVTPGYYSDFQIRDADAFRVTGKGLVIYDAVPDRLQLVAGVLYLGRDNLKVLPVGGAIWCPTDYFRFELIFPKPKLAACFNSGYGFEDWVYTTAEYGGNTYSIERTSGAHDKVTLQDFRILLGVERKLNGGTGYMVEAGYVFGRRVDYLSGLGDFEPGDTVLLRAGVVF